ncbi:Proline-rich receptor-like protein kinase PERK15 [Morella rubra]|uniref:non-specific serine/threonine protein kinase n=1 Tax=Morella rubra TaxID=262757 RepID=A0A6A1WQG9_9ROSI|nr:Proline-rich receptor-like protein kinase PERK15 [Morella rubra]
MSNNNITCVYFVDRTVKLQPRCRIFSYGVTLLELMTGRRPMDTTHTFMDDSLVDWARPLLSRALEDGNFDALVDPRLQNGYDPNEMGCMATCVRHSAWRRPASTWSISSPFTAEYVIIGNVLSTAGSRPSLGVRRNYYYFFGKARRNFDGQFVLLQPLM